MSDNISGRNVPDNLTYTKEHEWIDLTDGKGKVGITDFAQSELGDIVFVELPEGGRRVSAGESVAVVESVKSVSDIYSPASGTISAVNDGVDPALINSDPYGAGWLFEIEIAELGETMTPAEYRVHIG